jgi:LAO/AO transport system kinase
MDLALEVAGGNRLALSRLLSLIENQDERGLSALDDLYPCTGTAHIVGITGPSGSGKSTLVNRLALDLVDRKEKKPAIIAVDPTSPFSGGALLGDRVRMRDLSERPEIFIRSMATRGALGGLARATGEAALAMDAAGYEVILIETVGAGQSEVEIARLAHTTVVIEAPGLGDDVQAAKAGILEIADILVVNKSDKPNASTTANALKAMLEIGEELRKASGEEDMHWTVPVLQVSALNGEGITELSDEIARHRDWLKKSGAWESRSRDRSNDLVERLLKEKLFEEWRGRIDKEGFEQAIAKVNGRVLSPRQALEILLQRSSKN